MMGYILAGDVGGTKTVLCLYRLDNEKKENKLLQEVKKVTYASSQFEDFMDLLAAFLEEVKPHRPSHVCFGIAGPIHEQRCEATNLPWLIDARVITERFDFDDVYLLNDLEVAAHGMLCLPKNQLVELNPDASPETGHMAVIAAGTGLGEAILAWDGQRHIIIPSEGGHCDFAPNSDHEDNLLTFLRNRFGGHVSYERILAGSGFSNLYDYLSNSRYAAPNPEIEAEMNKEDRNAVISRHGLLGNDPLCTETIRLFVYIYGSEAGNLALKCLPRGGIYIGGGIAPKIRAVMENGDFMRGFLNKGRMAHAIKHIPVRLSLNADAPLLGAAHIANKRYRRESL